MCDFSDKLVAWMDGELAENKSAAMERHVQACPECRERVAAYEEVSRRFASYCDAVLAASEETTTETKVRRKLPLWVPVLGASVAAAVLLLALLPRPPKPTPTTPQVAKSRPAIVVGTPASPLKPVQHRHVTARRKAASPDPNWAMAEPAIQIAIPAEAMFPPGAVPKGANYIANLSLAANGSVQGVRLQP